MRLRPLYAGGVVVSLLWMPRASGYELPSDVEVSIKKNRLAMWLYWDADPGFPNDTAVEIEIHVASKCLVMPPGGKDNSPLLKDVDTNLPGGAYVDVWNFYKPPDKSTLNTEVRNGCHNPVLTAGMTHVYDPDTTFSTDPDGNFALGLYHPSQLKKGIPYYYSLPLAAEVPPAGGCSSAVAASRVGVRMQKMANTCTISLGPTGLQLVTNCPFVLGGNADICSEWTKNPEVTTSLWERICAPTNLFEFGPTPSMVDQGQCIDADGDGWFGNYGDPPANSLRMYGSAVGDCDDTDPVIHPGAQSCTPCTGMADGAYCAENLPGSNAPPNFLTWCSAGLPDQSLSKQCEVSCLANPPGVDDTCCGDAYCDSSHLEDCSRCAADCGDCPACSNDAQCAQEQYCSGGSCISDVCQQNTLYCAGGNSWLCNGNGSSGNLSQVCSFGCSAGNCSSCSPNCASKCGGASDGCTGTCNGPCAAGYLCANQFCQDDGCPAEISPPSPCQVVDLFSENTGSYSTSGDFIPSQPINSQLILAPGYFTAQARVNGAHLEVVKSLVTPPPGNAAAAVYWGGIGPGNIYIRYQCMLGEAFECTGAAAQVCAGAGNWQTLSFFTPDANVSCGLGKQSGTTLIDFIARTQ